MATPISGAPELTTSQANKESTHNAALRQLEALSIGAIENMTTTVPPASPSEGVLYIPASGASGAWSTFVGKVVQWSNGAWVSYPPFKGLKIYNKGIGNDVRYNGSAWVAVAQGGDMATSTYDTNLSGVVDNSEALNGQPASYYLSPSNLSAVIPVSKGGLGSNASSWKAGFVKASGSGTFSSVKCNYTATAAPSIGNDGTQGYSIGSRWIDVTNKKEYICLDTTTLAAVWKETTIAAASTTDQIDAHIETVANKTYYLRMYCHRAGTINGVRIISGSGTCTAAVKINGTNVTGLSAVSVSSTLTNANATGANTFTVGQEISMALSSNISCLDLRLSLQITYS